MMCGVISRLAGIKIPLFVLALLAMNSQLEAQVIFAGPGGNDNDAMKKQFVDSLAQKKLSAENRIQSRIADIDRACDLTEMQEKKLAIASKGAINAFLEKEKKSIEQQAKAMGIDLDFDELDTEEPEEDEEDNDNNAAGGAAMMVRAFALGGPFGNGNTNVENSKIWKTAIKKVLSEDQSKKWDEWQEQRDAYQRRVAVEQFVAKVDRKLLLSPEQREELAKYVDEKHGKKLHEQATSGNQNGLGMNVVINGRFGGPNAADNEEADEMLKEILTESQLQEWQESFERELSGRGGNFNFIGNAVNGINIVEELNVGELGDLNVDEDDK